MTDQRQAEGATGGRWRIAKHSGVRRSLYEGDRFVCWVDHDDDAQRLVDLLNRGESASEHDEKYVESLRTRVEEYKAARDHQLLVRADLERKLRRARCDRCHKYACHCACDPSDLEPSKPAAAGEEEKR